MVMTVASVAISSCRKPRLADEKPKQATGIVSASPTFLNIMQKRNLNPYSTKAIRKVKDVLRGIGNPHTTAAANAAMKNENYQLYYSFTPQNNEDWAAMDNWLAADSMNEVVPFPIDSVSLYPHIFTDDKLETYTNNPTTLYTTVKVGKALPIGVSATLLDTLYVPGDDEKVLNFMSNMLTGNFNQGFVQELMVKDLALHDMIMKLYDNGTIVYTDNITGVPQFPPGTVEPIWDLVPQAPYDEMGDQYFMSDPPPRDGRITFTENTLGVQEGVRRLRLQFVRFTFMGTIHAWTYTDNDGFYSVNNVPPIGTGVLYCKFKNERVKVKPLNTNNVGGVIGTVLNMPLPATHAHTIGATTNAHTININFDHGTFQALWSIILNGIAEANDYTVATGMRSNVNQSEHLTIVAYYRPNRSDEGTTGSAPMFSYIGYNTTVTSWMSNLFGINNPPPVANDPPDMLIMQAANNPYNSNELRQTIYHEYGHTLHYFKTNDDYWRTNINKSLPGSYGNAINTDPGDFFALSEGWADYVGHTFAFMRYGNNVQDAEISRWLVDDPQTAQDERTVTGNYQQLLEIVPTYNNNFIPRGLFYDLTDANTANENDFDLINGFTTNQIYQKLSPTLTTIQAFRTLWQNDHPNVNNALLFNRYGIQ